MIYEEPVAPPEYIYPLDEWRMVEKRFHRPFLAATESIMATSNGYLGMRGGFEEGAPVVHHGTFINGFYESWPIIYPEAAYGFAKTGQALVNAPDGKIIKLYVDDEPFFLPTAHLLHYERVLDMQKATLDRAVIWEMPSGKQVEIKSRRLVSLQHRHLAAIIYEVTLRNAQAPVVISSELVNHELEQASDYDPRQGKRFADTVLMPTGQRGDACRAVCGFQTRHSKMTLGCGMDHVLQTDCKYTVTTAYGDDEAKVVFSLDAEPGVPITLVKYLTYHSSRSVPPHELMDRADRTLDRAVTQGPDDLLTGQRAFMDDFWKRSDVEVQGDPEVQHFIRFNIFQMCQATARAEGAGIPAKGLTGAGYEGHYFWDAEIYVLPFLIYTAPRIAKNMLKFRYSMLEKARQRAREVNQRGALFPWRTINGEEASAYYAAGTAQYHINADIIYALKKYVDVSGDEAFLYGEGAEMLVETARLWIDLGFFSDAKGGQFCINGVTGPDEYNTVVNNNTYTNLMARENLWYAAKIVRTLQQEQPQRYAVLVHRTGLQMTEPESWQEAADRMFLATDEHRHIHLQDDSFLDRKPWDFENTPRDKYPLLLHYHPLVIYRHQVIKQADVVLAMFLLGDEFTAEQKKQNYEFYDPMTTGDSSLSACIQSIMAFETGHLNDAARYSRFAALVDLRDLAGNVADGLHIASIGGTWMVITYGYAGMRDYDGQLSFNPKVTARARTAALRTRFRLMIRGQTLEVAIDFREYQVTYLLVEGTGISITHREEPLSLKKDVPVRRDLEPPEDGTADADGGTD